ncbi:MAG: TerB family tellurite resistance protein [Hyphomicrobiales bacterium]|nr:TerB family tellurite resistance protein [Hyphomicrobiales bacterium]
MLDSLRTLIDEIRGAEPQREFAAGDYRVAAAALLVNMAHADGHVAPQERARLKRLVEERFELDPAAARRLISRAAESEREAVDLFQFTNVLKRALDEDGRRGVIELLWDMAYADGEADEIEENIIWRIAELLGVSTRDRVLLKQKAGREGPEPMPSVSPWNDEGGGI